MNRSFLFESSLRMFVVLGLLFGMFFAFSLPIFAQFIPEGQGISLVSNPEYPGPQSSVTLEIQDYTVETLGMVLDWYIDGVQNVSFQNERSITIPTKKLGEKTTVTATFTRSGTPILSTTYEVIPRQIDLILEADTYVPSFYEGRALPSSESNLRGIAVVHDGEETDPTSLTYTWSHNDEILFGGPVRGKYMVDIKATRFNDQTLSVTVANDRGDRIGEKTYSIRPTEPFLAFYEYNPLRGLVERAITGKLPLISEEVTVYAEPFFFHVPVRAGRGTFSFTINGDPINSTDGGAPNAITLKKTGVPGNANVGLQIVSNERIPQLLRGAFGVFFE